METIIKPKIKELLFNKGWRYKLNVNKHGIVENSLAEQKWNENKLQYVDIDIFQVIMWLYEKHGIWVEVRHIKTFDVNRFHVIIWNYKDTSDYMTIHCENEVGYEVWDSPTEAYSEAIKYVLTNLI